MKFKKRTINENMNEAVLMKEKWGSSWKPGEEGDISGNSLVFEGLDIGYCGINDTVPGCAC